MRIVYITSSLPAGAGESFVIPEIGKLQKLGHEVLLLPLFPRGPVVHTDANSLLQTAVVEPLISPRIIFRSFTVALSNPQKAALILTWLCKSPKAAVFLKNSASIPKALWCAHVVRQCAAEHIHVHWSATTATLGMAASVLSGIPFSITAHRYDILENNLLAEKFKRAKFVRFISRKGMETARHYALPSFEQKARVIHMGVEIPIAAAPSGPGPFTVLCPAHFLPVKGHRFLIEAAAFLQKRHIAIQVLLAGSGILETPLRAQVQRAGLGRTVRFLGQLSHAAVLDLLQTGTIHSVVLPSIDLGDGECEGIPVALVEAMARGIPVISTLTGGIPELLEKDAGILVPHSDSEALANAISKLIENPELQCRLGKRGRKRVQEQFDLEQIACELSALFAASER